MFQEVCGSMEKEKEFFSQLTELSHLVAGTKGGEKLHPAPCSIVKKDSKHRKKHWIQFTRTFKCISKRADQK